MTDEFARIIYRNWKNTAEQPVDWGDYQETVERIYDFLNEKLADELEIAINRKVWQVEENAFIAGFEYACSCITAGKIEFGKGGVSA